MNKQAVVITSFGTSVPQARCAVTAVEQALAAFVPEHICIRAFTSPAIRRILASRGEQVPSLAESLHRLKADGIRSVIVQPTHLIYGFEYDKLKAEAESFAGSFASLKIGRPLLADSSAIQQSARRLSESHPVQKGHAVVFMGHGTQHFANAVYPALQTAFRLLNRNDLYVGTVEGWPGPGDILQQLKADAPCHVHLLPLMLTAGDHARNDMAVDWKGRLEQAGHIVSCSFTGLGELPWVQEMYRERLAEAL